MIKKLLISIFCVSVLFGCQKEIICDEKDTINNNGSTGIEIEIYKGVSTFPSLKTVIHNYTDEELLTGEYFELDVFENNQWKKVELLDGIAFHDIGIVVEKQSSRDFTYELKTCYGELKSGRYRIRHTFENESKEKREVIKEFYIK